MAFSTTVHEEYKIYAEQWVKNKDCARDKVHQKKEVYLPRKSIPQQLINSSSDYANQEIFLQHKYNTEIWPQAVFFNFTGPTKNAWTGLIMSKQPTIKFADSDDTVTSIDFLIDNADGSGNGLITVSRLALEATQETGGGGFLTTSPVGTMTALDLQKGINVPLIKMFDRSDILNWESKYTQGRKQLVYLKLREFEFYSDNDESKVITKHIEFFKDANGVRYEITRDNPVEPDYPAFESDYVMENGKILQEIDFDWFGANDNDESPDPAPLTPIASLNVKHYQMSSANDHQLREAGQAHVHIDYGNQSDVQVHLDDGTSVSIAEYLNPLGVQLGVNSFTATTNGGKMELLQIQTDNLLSETPAKILEEARMLGAQIPDNQKNKTATATEIEFGAKNANLITLADNVSIALLSAIKRVARKAGYAYNDIQFQLNRDLITKSLDAQSLQQLRENVNSGLVPLNAAFWKLQQTGNIPYDWTFEQYLKHLQDTQQILEMRFGSNETVVDDE